MTTCSVFRCSRQPDLYLYVRTGVEPGSLPAPLLKRAGKLSPVMELELSPARKLARVDVVKVIAALDAQGWYLQLPPDGLTHGNLQDGD